MKDKEKIVNEQEQSNLKAWKFAINAVTVLLVALVVAALILSAVIR